jgi:hypothetical protein
VVALLDTGAVVLDEQVVGRRLGPRSSTSQDMTWTRALSGDAVGRRRKYTDEITIPVK